MAKYGHFQMYKTQKLVFCSKKLFSGLFQVLQKPKNVENPAVTPTSSVNPFNQKLSSESFLLQLSSTSIYILSTILLYTSKEKFKWQRFSHSQWNIFCFIFNVFANAIYFAINFFLSRKKGIGYGAWPHCLKSRCLKHGKAHGTGRACVCAAGVI